MVTVASRGISVVIGLPAIDGFEVAELMRDVRHAVAVVDEARAQLRANLVELRLADAVADEPINLRSIASSTAGSDCPSATVAQT